MNNVAIICPIKDENTYIRKFFEYYLQHVNREDIYILDFGSSQEYIEKEIIPNANVIRSKESILDAPVVFSEIKRNMKMLQQYDFVIPIDVDEILFYNKKGGLRKFFKNIKGDIDTITCRGYEVIHIPSLQEDINLKKPWFKQLKYWHENSTHYAKTLITRHPLNWMIGFHGYYVNGIPQSSADENTDDNLFLIHLHRHNYKTTIDRHIEWANMKWSDGTVDNNYNYHYRIKEESKVKAWYFEPILNQQIYEIPEIIIKNINI